MFSRLSPLIVSPVAVLLFAGCCSTGHRDVGYVAPAAVPAPCDRCAGGAAVPPRIVPAPVVAPPPGAPPCAVYAPPGAVYAPPSALAPPASLPPSAVVQGSYTPGLPSEPTPISQEPSVRLSPPELSVPAAPQTAEPPLANTPPQVSERRETPASSPIDIPQFKLVRENVATGLQPFPDGVAWLKANGYRAVLHVRSPGQDDTAAHRQFEKHGLRYIVIDADARSLSKEAVDTFNRIVADQANLPLFVYDADGSLTGGLWYLHYRLVEGWPNDKALAEAARLGFRQEQDDSHRTMWIAIQKLLEANGR
jgi:protein tyrosine phosphatase (PTP) superfamily phosphohydrolase (DUF442 family)